MTSSSAFSNVLSASQVQPASNPASGRSLTDSEAGPGFKSAFAEVRAEQDIKPRELGAKKGAADKSLKAKAAPDNTAEAAPVANQKTSALSPKKVTKGEEKDPQDTVSLGADDSEKKQCSEPLLAIDIAVIAPVAPPLAEANIAVAEPTLIGELDAAGETIDAPAIDAALATLPVAATAAPATSELAQLAAEPTEDISVTLMTEMVGDKAPAPAATSAAAAIAATPAAATIPEAIAAAGLTPLKSAETTVATAAGDTPVADADTGLVVSDEPLADKDPKAVFEKMLQAIASSATTNGNAGGDSQKAPDLAATLAALAPAADTSTAAGVETLARGPETQLPYARNFVVQTAVPVNVGQPGWSQAVGEKVLWLAAQNVQSAEIRLDPPELGPMMVKVSVHQEQTNISFTSHNAGVRELLEQNQGRLRDMFTEQGLNLVNVDVSDKSFQRQQGDTSEQQGQGARSEQEEEESVQAVASIVQQRLVDHYA